LNSLLQDVRYALRGIRKAPLLFLAALLALSAGIGLNAAIFTLMDVTWLRAPVEKNPSSFVQAIPSYSGWFDGENVFHGFTVKDYEAIRARARSLTEVAAFNGAGGVKLDDDSAETGLGLVTCNFFHVYGWTPVKGRVFSPQECATPGSSAVIVITEALWRNRFAADPHIVGRTVRINQHPYTVVGVIRARAPLWLDGDLWVPYTMQPHFYDGYDGFIQHPDYPWLSVVGRLNPGYTRSDAQAELRIIESQQDRSIPGRKTAVEVTNGSFIQNPESRSLGLLVIPLVMGPMALLLLVACTNVTMLFLSRAAARRSEIAIRLALGAGHSRLLRMLATEGFVVAAAAGSISVYLAYKLPGAFWAFFLPQLGYREIGTDWRVFAYLAGATLLAGGIAGFAPARESVNVDLVTSLKGREGAATGRSRRHSVLIVAQIAMSFVLVAAGVLFMRLRHSITSMDPGFETRRVFVVPLKISEPPYTQESAASFYRDVRERVSEIPGVQSASYTNVVPFSGTVSEKLRRPGENIGQGQEAVVERVSTEFFSTLEIPIVRGRSFQQSDAAGGSTSEVAVVSQVFSAAFWNGVNPLGKVVVLPDNSRLTVVGVARDTKSGHFDVPDGPRLYTVQSPHSFSGSLLVRFEGEPRSLARVISKAVHNLDASQLVVPQTLQSIREARAENFRPVAEVILMMACLTVFLALSGIYGAVSFSMSQRMREFGIRMALGATKARILRSLLAAGLQQIAIGLAFGMLLALPAAFSFRHLVGRSTVFDWSTYCIAALTLTAAVLAACYIPARRAMKVDPMVALRYE
jgi:predicted permease